MIWIKSLGLKVWAYVVAGGMIALLLARIYNEGAKGVKVSSLEDTLEAIKRRNTIEADIDTIDDDDVVGRLRKQGWFKD
ncbi:MAG: hypothetical protein GQ574_14675 [Crocinitomix sp.]|nr:hypothetical protein [Crocinitomix sp.]